MCFEYQKIKFQGPKWVNFFTFAYVQGRGGWPPPLLQPANSYILIVLSLTLRTIISYWSYLIANCFGGVLPTASKHIQKCLHSNSWVTASFAVDLCEFCRCEQIPKKTPILLLKFSHCAAPPSPPSRNLGNVAFFCDEKVISFSAF